MSKWLPAQFFNGAGKARQHCDAYEEMLGYPMVGTLNYRMPSWFRILEYGTALLLPHPNLVGDASFWLVELKTETSVERCYAYRFPGSRQSQNVLELISKREIQGIKSESMIRVLEPWAPSAVKLWCDRHYTKSWHQTFDWSPREFADTDHLWSVINEDRAEWGETTLLDIGCGWGAITMRAAKLGAVSVGCDINQDSITAAQQIANHIEMSDAKFAVGNVLSFIETGIPDLLPVERPDVVTYLSVHHQFDPSYSGLQGVIDQLRRFCRQTLYVELIRPPMFGKGIADFDRMVRKLGGSLLGTYQHSVRGVRSVYRFRAVN